MLPLQGANGLVVLFTQGVAIGLDYIGPSARSMCRCKRLKSGFFATKWQHIPAQRPRPGDTKCEFKGRPEGATYKF